MIRPAEESLAVEVSIQEAKKTKVVNEINRLASALRKETNVSILPEETDILLRTLKEFDMELTAVLKTHEERLANIGISLDNLLDQPIEG